MEIEIEHLISLIEERPTIWDRNLKSHKNKAITRAAWREIFIILNKDFEKLVDREQDEFAASIYTSRGFEGYQPSTCMPGSSLRFLGPSVRIALPLTILWGVACSFQMALIVNVALTLLSKASPENAYDEDEIDYEFDNNALQVKSDMVVLAIIELGLALLIILAVVLVLRIDCKYDPD